VGAAREQRIAVVWFEICPGDTLFARITPVWRTGRLLSTRGTLPDWFNRVLCSARSRKRRDPAFVFYFSQNKGLRSSAEKSMSGASGRQRAKLSALSEFECEFPPLPAQRLVAGILSTYDEFIENSQRRIQILEALARALYREWFVDSGSPATRSSERSVPLGDIPRGGR